MRAVGLITEYNPFHNGHLYHLQQSKQVSGADVSVAVMSGHFLQRGEPALLDKWQRTRMALSAGVDLVIELPLPWACSSAPDFARGGVLALTKLGGIEALCFGSEAGGLEPLQDCARQLLASEQELQSGASELLRQGINYPTARAAVMARLSTESHLLATPNNILGLEYLKVLEQSGSVIKPYTVGRIGAGYHDVETVQGIASATGIRQRIANGESVETLMPQTCATLLGETLEQGGSISERACFRLLSAQLFREPRELSRYWLVAGGIENRLVEAADQATTLEDLIRRIKSRQFTRTRIQRMLMAIMLGWTPEQVEPLLQTGPRYLHLLGSSPKGEQFLAHTRKQRELPLIQNFSRVYATLKKYYGITSQDYGLALGQLQLEITATRMYGLLLNRLPSNQKNRDFDQNIIRRK